MVHFKGHFLPGKVAVTQIPLWGAPGLVMLKSPGAPNHFQTLFLLTQGIVYVHFIALCTGLWVRKIYSYWHVSPWRGKWALEAAPKSVQVRGLGSPQTQRQILVQGHKGCSERWCLTADIWETEVCVTCPLQSQGSLKVTYSPSLLYMPRLVLVGFSLASSWNCILAILSKSLERWRWTYKWRACPGSYLWILLQFSSVAQSCPTLCDPMNRSMPGLPVHHQLPEFTQTHVHRVGDAIQPSHPLSSPSPPAPNPSQHQGLFQWVNSLHEVAKVLEFQLQHQFFQWLLLRSYLLLLYCLEG